ncbi:hypothetical protein [Mesorhizobium sp. IMUNJ 23232]|uniref:hypothetical protein n=1 Tax=Mesorhizobium sp. IMUNJ 23232 TaxID=3376064 RepID=UPI0037A2754E
MKTLLMPKSVKFSSQNLLLAALDSINVLNIRPVRSDILVRKVQVEFSHSLGRIADRLLWGGGCVKTLDYAMIWQCVDFRGELTRGFH